jgi:hypothetical protein
MQEANVAGLAESWIDLTAQQPASSSPHAARPHPREESISNTIRNQTERTFRRRRLTVSGAPLLLNLPRRPSSVDNSSQDEYDESESEPDHVLTSSNEDIYHSTLASQLRRGEIAPSEDETEDGDDQDENDPESAIVSGTCFTPQPNAFSHPPTSMHRHSEPIPGSYFPATNRTTAQASSRQSNPSRVRRHTHDPYTAMSPAASLDHDALLRDSLSTLLTCAAAARGVSKSPRTLAKYTDQAEPSTLHIGTDTALLRHSTATSSRSSSKSKGKRKANASRSRSSSNDRQASTMQHLPKKPRRNSSGSSDDIAAVSPTLLTWFVAGGVVVLVSALSFSAGYAVGKESGRFEGLSGLGQDGTGEPGRDAIKGGLGLRRLRWSSGSVAAAVGA